VTSNIKSFCEDMEYALGRRAPEKRPIPARSLAIDDHSERLGDGLEFRGGETSRVVHPGELGSDASKSGRVVELPPLEPELGDAYQSIEGRAVSPQDLVFDRLSILRHGGESLTTVRELPDVPS
jgi:hypothetical protein